METSAIRAPKPRNRYDRMEWAGAFGDLGTMIPFLVAYFSVLKLDPCGVLFAFGVSMLVCGFVYRTPFPVQPMKAIGAVATTQAAQSFSVTAGAVYGASLVTAVIWLVLGLTGTAQRVARLVNRPVVVGIILGLGFNFMLDGAKMMAENWWISGAALSATALLLTNRTIPAMFVLLLFGVAYGIIRDPSLLDALRAATFEPRLPSFALGSITLNELVIGAVFLALPQVPLTLGNAVIAITDENNRLFPDRPVNERMVATSTGAMNLLSATVGGVPMCHGAGGMAGHVQFGARTGGALVIAGAGLLALALFFSGSVATLFQVLPPSILGVILFLMGAQLALGACDLGEDKGDRFVAVITGALAMYNIGIAFVVGMVAYHLHKRGWLRV